MATRYYGDEINSHIIETNNDTNVRMITFKYSWTIHNFSRLNLKIGQVLDSSVFPDISIYELKFSLKLYPRGNAFDYKDYISLFLCMKSSNSNQTLISFKVNILNKNCETKFKKLIVDKLLTQDDSESGWSNFVRRDYLLDTLNGFLQNDKLTVLCEVSFSLLDHLSISLTAHNIAVFDSQMSDDFELMFENEEFSDVTLSVVGEEFRVHKCILAGRSSVFKNMLYNIRKETQQNRIEIEDMNPKVLRELLRFIYTGKVFNLEEVASDLLIAADKYALEILKLTCGKILCNSLSVKNVIRTFILADDFGMSQVKSLAIEFLNAHFKEVINTDKWKSLIKTHPHLVTEAYLALSTLQLSSKKPLAKYTRTVYFVDK